MTTDADHKRAMNFMLHRYGPPPRGYDDDGNEKADWWLAKLGTLVDFLSWSNESASPAPGDEAEVKP